MFTTVPGQVSSLQLFKSKLSKTAHLSNALSQHQGLIRIKFDPINSEHCQIFANFLAGNGWSKGITFFIESPHITVPATCTNSILNHFLKEHMQHD